MESFLDGLLEALWGRLGRLPGSLGALFGGPVFQIIWKKNVTYVRNGASTIKTLFQRPSGGSRDSVVFGSSASGVKGGKSMKMCLNLWFK